ncbi:unnamed protein product [Ilex paraguariensis]|uniref:Endonuclease/exonuclease/phosphatase domain-containing protein n=1 Tax=Ilex paraguariensis TaxID=185542 RepID=A0ABC8UGZ4_9AQUA
MLRVFTIRIEICCSKDPEWADVKLAQAKFLLSRIAQFKMQVSDKFETTPSVIVAGDFNSVPGDKVCQYSHDFYLEISILALMLGCL